ncbi:MAG: ADP-ribosylglycohydrolase family protein [Prevotella sp.]|uniref:ADP-ribosylglycohydrolase family protein n=1 Tax=Prevotella sp. TaxID=59823 RepID=UPI002A320D65|nr:ADP-ribosylglycohydrolase family protein [Prevotella sp.]MDD7317778.1 ADP-ribosylglycohydrolase family protein [Prevotellaceae bacterium]MDY4020693.1 ADP-ribosylglycohydrolase family protein [Prevotella sp.]
MLGAIIGDIVGSRFESGPAPQAGFELFTSDCGFTDDTVCTVAIADAILNRRDYAESLVDWCRRYSTPMKGGYGGMFFRWFLGDDHRPYGSYGNGSAMRVSAVGWLFDDIDTVMEEARRSAEVTHNHEEGIRGAQCTATLIYWLRTVRITKNRLKKSVESKFGYEIPPLKDIMRIGALGHFDGTCQETVPAAIRCFLESESFEDTIRKAVLADGDTDTKAAIAGSIAEAYYELPDTIVNRALEYLPNDMLDVVTAFCDKVTGGMEK